MMTIKQHGGIFGRNPTFNNVTVDGTLTVDQIVEKTGAAGITLDGVTLKDGNVVLDDGKGIDFSATAGTGTSELFDDYEEGAWTPSIGGTATYSNQEGYYTKVGRLVHAYFDLTINLIGTGSTSVVSGLPFSKGLGTNAVSIGFFQNLALSPVYLAGGVDGATSFSLNGLTAGAASMTYRIAVLKNSARVQGTLIYNT
jgi:hypothetical protein